MPALRLSISLLALTQLLASSYGAVAHTTSRYPATGTTPAPGPGQSAYPNPYATQQPRYAVQPLSDADLLASEIRLLAADPNNLQALVRAGELALKLDDDTAAAAFFARAERIDPHNARVKAGEGSLLVAAERPGEALRRFAEAQSYGADPRSFAADRGLAYDLIGEQDRAQSDYRTALRGGANDETQRRYALSLAISGKRDLALAQIDPLLRKSDRGAWRARAFILAMSGDKTGAEKIATTMMPTGMAQGLQPFFEILPRLRPADLAFAVHFGEVRATPERLSDARLVPPLAALGPDPTAPVEVVAGAGKPKAVALVETRKERKARLKREQQLAVTTQPPPLPATPAYGGEQVALVPTASRMPPISTPVPPRRPATSLTASSPAARTPAAAALAPAPAATTRPAPTPVRSEESILAAIIADIKVPRTERQTPPTVVRSAPRPAPKVAFVPAPALADQAATDRAAENKQVEEKKVEDKKAADKKALADKKLLAGKKAAADKKAAEAKELADAKKAEEKRKHDPKLLEPSRVWVQVSGGANERDLPKQWAKVRAQSTKMFRGKDGWTTPLRATNRILTGPFKSEEEGQRFVNTLGKDGISGFVFVSEAGQKITKLAAK